LGVSFHNIINENIQDLLTNNDQIQTEISVKQFQIDPALRLSELKISEDNEFVIQLSNLGINTIV
jgi:hypothetical protein